MSKIIIQDVKLEKHLGLGLLYCNDDKLFWDYTCAYILSGQQCNNRGEAPIIRK